MKSYYDKLLEMAEYKAFHGTPNVFYEFDHRLSGNEGLGAGFYFTDDPSEASGYAEPKYKDDPDSSNIKIVKLNINNPIILDLDNNPKQRPLNRTQISKLLKASPYFNKSLTNFGDVDYEGFNKVFNEAVSGFLNIDLFRQFELIRGDFYDDDLKIYAPIFKKITGYDAIKKTYNDGHNVYVVWDNDQIKNYYGESYNLSEQHEDLIEFATDPRFNKYIYGNPSIKEIKELNNLLNTWKTNIYTPKIIRLYHGTSKEHNILDNGLLQTSNIRKKSYQSTHGYVYLTIFPDRAKLFAELAYPYDDIVIYQIDIPIYKLLPDKDQLANKRLYGDNTTINNTLADSLIYGGGFRVKGNIPNYNIKIYKEYNHETR